MVVFRWFLFYWIGGMIGIIWVDLCKGLKKYKESFNDGKLWFIFSVVSVMLLPLVFSYSTFVDRIAIYFLPIQLVVFSRVPVLIQSTYNRTIFILGVIIVYFFALFTWLNFGNFSSFWLPYQNIITT